MTADPAGSHPAILAFDLGQTWFKGAVFDPRGRLLAREVQRNTEHSQGSYRWQDPAEWWASAGRLSRALRRRPELNGHAVSVIGLSGRGAAVVPVDAAGAPLTGSWSDTRHRPQVERLAGWHGGDRQRARCAMPLSRYFWMRQEMPEVAARVRHLLCAKDWLVYCMTGRAVTDPTSGPDRPDFDRAAVAGLGVDPELLPQVALPWSVAGPLLPEAAEQLGLPAGIPVSVGGHDGLCANVGAGAGTPGGYAITMGTNAVVRAVTTDPPPGAFRFYGMPPDRHVIGQNALVAGRAADWFLDASGGSAADGDRGALFATMDAEAATVPAGAGGVRFLPYLAGTVAPVRRPGARAAFTGLRVSHGRPEMYRAVLEGGAFAIRAIWDRVRGWCGDPVVARFTGSGAQSQLWRQLVVDAIGWPVELTDGVAEARGAAIYAAMAAGMYADVDTAAAAMVHPVARIEPDAGRVAEYDAIYADWRQVVESMRVLDSEDIERIYL